MEYYAYAIRIETPRSFFEALEQVDKVVEIIGKEQILGLHQGMDASYLMFRTEAEAKRNVSVLRKRGVKCTYKGKCMYQKPTEDFSVGDAVPEIEDYKKYKDLEKKTASLDKEKADLIRKLGEMEAQLKARETELQAKKSQVTELIEWNRKAGEEKNRVISKLERQVFELERELKEKGKE